ncbi:hypothetical protein P692DRAFT_201935931 [Suillus brevipes Sb2]|nr:hypothetical protein P692DRAFT_201935931 [Suillus brevipes Sb2]
MRKFTTGITRKISKPFKSSHDRVPAVPENVDPQGTASSQKVEVSTRARYPTSSPSVPYRGAQDTPHLHPSPSNNNKHHAKSDIPSGFVNQGLPGAPASQVHALPDLKLVDAELQGARDGTQNMGLLGRHATSMASAAVNAPAGLAAENDFETTYLQPLKVIDVVLEKIADVHPYAKMALGLSVATKIIIAQAQRDKSIKSLLEKMAEVYRFLTQDDSLGKIESMRSIVGKIVQQILECARLIKGYSETQGFEITPKGKYTKAQYQKAIARFRSVMGQIFATAEPLPLASLQAMRHYFPEDHEHYEVDGAIKGMGALLSGTTHSDTPIRPLHATFQEFLTDESSSGDFFVERTNTEERNLAFASLRVMEHGLRFNICDLKSSYLPNSQDTGLPERVKTSIPPHLSYSCRHWATHVQTTDFDDTLATEVRSLFDNERLMFWVEALGLLKAISGATTVLPLVAKWLKSFSTEPKTFKIDVEIHVNGG